MKKSFFRFCSVAILGILLLSPDTAAQGAKNGLLLWAGVVLPALLPFMICSNVIVALNGIRLLILPFRFLLGRFLKLSDAGGYILVSGLLCGYPMGAKSCSDFLDEGRITPPEAKYLLSICNHPSPMFLLGFVALKLPPGVSPWLLLCSVYLPVLFLAPISRKLYGIKNRASSLPVTPWPRRSFDDSLLDSCDVMVKIGVYIMLFSILALYVLKLPILESSWKAPLLGFIEITTGIQALSAAIPTAAGGMWIAAAAAFGGFSGIFQTKSVIKNAGLSIRHYTAWKAAHSLLSAVCFILLAWWIRLPVAG